MSLADAFDLLAKNKSIDDDVFRNIFVDPATRYPAVRESIAAFQDATTKARIIDNRPLIARYVRVLAIIVENEQHIQHLSVSDWASLVRFLGWAYSKLSIGPRDRGFVKNVYDLFRALELLLQANESIDSSCFDLILYLCEDFCGQGQQRETSCHQFVMACVRIMTQLQFEKAQLLGNRLIQMGKPRQDRFKYEMFAFACLVPQSMDDLAAIGPAIIEFNEVEFTPAPHLGLPWFRPSPEADLGKFIAAKALAARTNEPSQSLPSSTVQELPAKRPKTDYGELDLMACAFGYNKSLSTADMLSVSGDSFWTFVVLAQQISQMNRAELLEVWMVSLDHIQYVTTASSACFCLAHLVPKLVDPEVIDESVLGRLKTLLVAMGESSYPSLSSGSLLLWRALSCINVLDREFQALKAEKLNAWLTKSVVKPPSSLLVSFFGQHCDLCHIDIRGMELLKSLESVQRLNRVINNSDPYAMRDTEAPYEPASAHFEKDLIIPRVDARDVRTTLWYLAILAHSGQWQSVSDFKPQPGIKAVSNADIRSIIWFSNLVSAMRWPRGYLDSALKLMESLESELTHVNNDSKASLDIALALIEASDSNLAAFVAGRPEAIDNDNPATAIRSLQHIFQSYSLQRSPFVVANILRLLNNPRYAGLPEYDQLLPYLKTFISVQSPYSRLRPLMANLLFANEDLADLVANSSLENALMALPVRIESDELALRLLDSFPLQGRKAAGFVLMLRGASPAQVIAFLFKQQFLSMEDFAEIATLFSMTTPNDLVMAVAMPLLLGIFAEFFEPLVQFTGSHPALDRLKHCHSRFLASPQSLTDSEASVIIEEVMRGCSYLSSAEEKVECISKCWLFVRAHSSQVSSDVLRTYVKGATALAGSINGQNLRTLESTMKLLLTDVSGIQGYADMAADIAYMGFPALAKRVNGVFEAANSNVMRVFWSIESMGNDITKAPVLLYELIRASGVTYEIWSLVIQQFIEAANRDLKALVEVFLGSSKLKELVSALQLWTCRLQLSESTRWMSFMGYMAAEVGGLLPELPLLGERTPQSFLRELLEVYNGLPYSKKWHLHQFMRRIDKGLVALPQLNNVFDYSDASVSPQNPNSDSLSLMCNTASKLANMALNSLGFPILDGSVFEQIPELITTFLPLLAAAGLEQHHQKYIKKLLTTDSEERLIALRVMQRYYEATKSFMSLELTIIDACELGGHEFAELGIACVEMLWGAEKQPLTTTVLKSLFKFYKDTQDYDLENNFNVAETDGIHLSHMRLGSNWRELDFNLVSFEANGDDIRLQQSLEHTGLWSLAFKAAGTQNYYDYEQSWWMQQWDLPPAPGRNRQTHQKPQGSEDLYAALFNLFSGHADETETFAQLGRIDFSMPGILHRMKDRVDRSAELPIVRHGRELFALRSGSQTELARELQTFSCQLRDMGELNDSTKYALKLEQLSDSTNDSSIKVISIVESSHSAWSLGNQTLALSMLRSIITSPILNNHLSTSVSTRSLKGDYTLAKVYSRLGTWSRLARHESDETIMLQYFAKAEEYACDQDVEQVFHYFAHFCDEASHDPLLNEELEDLERMRTQRQRELAHLKAVIAGAKADRDNITRKLYQVQKALASETLDYTTLLDRKKQLTLKCAEGYLKSLKAGDSYAEDMNCFIALWFELVSDVPVNQLIHKLLVDDDAVSLLSKKFLPWMNQLSSRLGRYDHDFQRALQLVITNALQRHPFHTLWQLINLYWSGTTTDTASMERKTAAKAIMERVRGRKQRSRLLRDLSASAKQMLTLMKIPVDKNSKSLSFRELGSDVDRWWRREFVKMELPVPTSSITPQDDDDYSNVPKVVRVGSEVTVAGGLSSPKILTFVDSTGLTSHMVLKHGTDDLRQDAIMQQVFEICNELLATAKGKRLRVRTYNVIPLGPAGGAIEFVEGARSLQEVLEPLHKKYGGSEEYTLAQARGIMRDIQRGDRATRVSAFKDVMAHTEPQMRRFWPIQMPDVHKWLTAKTIWCRSIAAMSIVGYVVGLGDRHCSNLLVDTVTGEVIHIDLGIAFDQGRYLSIPETVPFRLTRDVVDGMGVCGVDGPFTLAARTTLSLVREQQSRIMTVLEVLKHDALYSWRLPPLRLKQAKGGHADEEPVISDLSVNAGTVTGQAESALRSVKQKLSSNLNVEATVRDLVARARDTSNLAVMFCGWSPFY